MSEVDAGGAVVRIEYSAEAVTMVVWWLFVYDKTGPFGTCATHPIIVNLFTSKQHRMARLRSHKTQKALIRQYTPPPDLAQYVG